MINTTFTRNFAIKANHSTREKVSLISSTEKSKTMKVLALVMVICLGVLHCQRNFQLRPSRPSNFKPNDSSRPSRLPSNFNTLSPEAQAQWCIFCKNCCNGQQLAALMK